MNHSNLWSRTAGAVTSIRGALQLPRITLFVLSLLAWPGGRICAQQLVLSLPPTLSVPEDTVATIPFSLSQVPPGTTPQFSIAVPENSPIVTSGNATVRVESAQAGFLDIRPLPNANGTVQVHLSVTNGAQYATASCTVTWMPVDDVPILALIPNQTTVEGAPELQVPIRFWDPDPNPFAALSVSNSRPNIVKSSIARTGRTNHWVSLRPTDQARGSSVITVTAATREPANPTNSSQVSFVLTVLPRDLAPSNQAPIVSGLLAQAADLNRDGWLDLIMGADSGSSRPIYWNSGGRFSRISLTTPLDTSQVAWGDYDGDGDLDAYLGNPLSPGFIWQNLMTGFSAPRAQFKSLAVLGQTNRSYQVAWADFDGDGDLDLMTGGNPHFSPQPARMYFARNDGANRFTVIDGSLPPTRGPRQVADFDNDGRPDVLLSDTEEARHQAVVWHNEGAFRFTPTHFRVPAFELQAAGTADFDGDGWLDLWVQHPSATNSRAARTLVLWRQTLPGFSEALRIPGDAMEQAGPPAWGDFDGDGTPDFIAPTVSPVRLSSLQQTITNYVALYRNDGRGHFTPGGFLFKNRPGGSPAAGDFNRDGLLDTWTPDESGRVYFNQVSRPNLPPDAPSGLVAFAAGTNVLFTWLPARDPNQIAPLTYNLRVGTRPGANDLVPSMSLDDGTRLLPAPGNAGFAITRHLLLVPVETDTLYWSVQAVDNSFAGSVWAPEQTVSVTRSPSEPPVVTGLTDVVMDEDSPLRLSYTVTDDLTPPSGIRIQVLCSNPSLFPAFRTSPTPSNHDTPSTNRFLSLAPAENASGQAGFAIMATDAGGHSTTIEFTVTVRPINDPPILFPIEDQYGFVGHPLPPVVLTIKDVETPAEQIQVVATSSNQSLLPDSGITLSGQGRNRQILLTPATAETGQATIQIRVIDTEGAVDLQEFHVHFSPLAFTPVPGALNGQQADRLSWGDFNGDGRLDLLVVEWDSLQLRLWLNSGNGEFTRADASFPDSGLVQLAEPGDLDGDGDLDLAVAYTLNRDEPPRVAWWLNESGRFHRVRLPADPPYSAVLALRIADADGDGDLDLMVLESEGEAPPGPDNLIVRALLASKEGFQTRRSVVLQMAGPFSISGDPVFADQNGDGLMDVEVSFFKDNTHTSVAGFAQRDGFYVPVARPWHGNYRGLRAWSNFNGGNVGDALVASSDFSSLSLFPGWPVVGPAPNSTLPSSLLNVVAGDLDSDGMPDAVTYDGTLIIPYSHPRADAWRPYPVTRVGSLLRVARPLGDMDDDGDLDLAVLLIDAEGRALAGVLRNDHQRTNQPPAEPADLQVAINDREVELTWNPALDPQQTSGLSYNLRLGTSPGANDIMASQSLPDGHRLLPELGNNGWVTRRLFSTLPAGRTVYWSVQAVDASFVGGPFAPEQHFTTPEDPPRLTTAAAAHGLRLIVRRLHAGPLLLERSGDLRVWESMGTFHLDESGLLDIPLDPSPGEHAVFYRTRSPE